MGKYPPELKENEMQISQSDFLKSYNKNMPENFPRATGALLNRFKSENLSLFKHGDTWSLDLHRKKLFEWLSRNSAVSNS